jgi:hypothetical protein
MIYTLCGWKSEPSIPKVMCELGILEPKKLAVYFFTALIVMAISKQFIVISKLHIILETKKGFLVRNLVGLDPFWYGKQ